MFGNAASPTRRGSALGCLVYVIRNPRRRAARGSINRVDTAASALTIAASASDLVGALWTDAGRQTSRDALTNTSAFSGRRGGVDTKLIPDDTARGIAERLLLIIVGANDWFDQLKAGRTYERSPRYPVFPICVYGS